MDLSPGYMYDPASEHPVSIAELGSLTWTAIHPYDDGPVAMLLLHPVRPDHAAGALRFATSLGLSCGAPLSEIPANDADSMVLSVAGRRARLDLLGAPVRQIQVDRGWSRAALRGWVLLTVETRCPPSSTDPSLLAAYVSRANEAHLGVLQVTG
ncbi:MAG: hypothetical protein JWP95_1589 [Actinotalea sp.]|nr:hypothetical protein [Actinotalea sp.]